MERRQFLHLLGGGLILTSVPGLNLALAAPKTNQRLVVVLLRGGLDGLAAIPPYADAAYKNLRDRLALPEPGREEGILKLNGTFGLHPALTVLQPYWQRKQLALIHAVATPYRSRSHFDGQNMLETGMTRPNAAQDGWLNRALALYGGTEHQLGLAVGNAVPLILLGQSSVASWTPTGGGLDESLGERLSRIYAHDPDFQDTLGRALRTQDLADQLGLERTQGRTVRNNTANLRPLMEATAGFLSAENGPRVAAIDIGGWDTHANQGSMQGILANRLRSLAEGLDHLAKAMAPIWKQSLVLVVTEFGRTVAMNGTQGTDHGTGGVALVMGGALRGGGLAHGQWPGLAQNQLYQGRDLAPANDLRSLLKAALIDHLGLPQRDIDYHVFPNSATASPLRNLV